MSQLTTKLKGDHKALVAALEEIRKLGIAHPDAPKKLAGAKAALLAHLKHEDTHLYPTLQTAAQTNGDIKATLSVLAKDMEGIAKSALDFFAKYEKGGNPNEFTKDFARLHHFLATRIRREEDSLYPLFDTVEAKKAA